MSQTANEILEEVGRAIAKFEADRGYKPNGIAITPEQWSILSKHLEDYTPYHGGPLGLVSIQGITVTTSAYISCATPYVQAPPYPIRLKT